MDLGARFFWALMVILMTASAYFGVNAEGRRRVSQRSEGTAQDGETVRLIRVIDGDTVLAQSSSEERIVVRLVGIKAFEADNDKDAASRFARAAMDSLERTLRDSPATLSLHSTPRDAHGRTLASLWQGDDDIALNLVRQGLVLVYTAYPFERMAEYLTQMELARADREGLWADPKIARRADLLLRQWTDSR